MTYEKLLRMMIVDHLNKHKGVHSYHKEIHESLQEVFHRSRTRRSIWDLRQKTLSLALRYIQEWREDNPPANAQENMEEVVPALDQHMPVDNQIGPQPEVVQVEAPPQVHVQNAIEWLVGNHAIAGMPVVDEGEEEEDF